MRPKTRRRISILATVAIVLSLAGATLYFISARRQAARLAAVRQQGMTAYNAGDFSQSVRLLGQYFEKTEPTADAQALFAYGRSRMIHEPSVRHHREAIHVFDTYRRMKPDDRDAAHALLELYPRVGYYQEALTLADEVLARDDGDVVALRARIESLRAQRKFDDAFAAAERLLRAAPNDLYGQLLLQRLLSERSEKPANITARYEAELKAEPTNARRETLYALALQNTGETEKAKQVLKSAAAHAAGDAELTPYLSRVLAERFGLFDESLALLESAVATLGDAAKKPIVPLGRQDAIGEPSLLQMLLERKWQLGRYEEVANRLKDLDPASPSSDSGLLALRAISLYELDRAADAAPIAAAVARRDDDTSIAWAGAMQARYTQPRLTPAAMIKQYQSSLERDPDNAIIYYMLGEAYAAQGETELALAAWRKCVEAAPSWSAPLAMSARTLGATGRYADAMLFAQAAGRRTTSKMAVSTYLSSWYGLLADSNDQQELQKLLKTVQDYRKQTGPGAETIEIEASLLARTGHRDEAMELIRATLAAKPAAPQPVLLGLAAVSMNERLGLERDILSVAEQAYGPGPDIALRQAALLHGQGKTQQGVDLLKTGAEKATDADSMIAWQLALAQYLDAVKDPSALPAWVSLADAHPDKLAVQTAALRSGARQADRAFWKRAIDRVKAATGDSGYVYRLEQARWLLTGAQSDTDKAASEAIDLLTPLTVSSPSLVEPRRLLATAYEKVADAKNGKDRVDYQRRATDELKAVLALRPTEAGAADELTRLLGAMGKNSEAADVMNRLAKSALATPDARKRAARAYINDGRLEQAIEVLLPIGDGVDTTRDAMLAELYRRLGRGEEAAKLYDRLLDAAAPDPDALLSAADYFASKRESDHAEKFTAKLAELPLRPGQWELYMARYAEGHLETDDALKQYLAATEVAGAGVEAWRATANYQLRLTRFSDATATADKGLAAFPNDPELIALRAQAKALAAYKGEADVRALAAAMAADPRSPAAADMLKLITNATTHGEPPAKTVESMREIAERTPSLPLRGYVFRTYLALGKPAEAIRVADAAAVAAPNDPDPRRWLTGAFLVTEQWDKALTAARQWRERSIERPLEADIAIAQTLLARRPAKPDEAMKQLQPHLTWATTGAGNVPVANLYAKALIIAGRVDEAASLLRPLAESLPRWRLAWMEAASAFDAPDGAAAWLEKVTPLLANDAPSEKIDLAEAWASTAARLQWNAGFDKARDLLRPILSGDNPPAKAWQQWAFASEQLGDLPEAERGYRALLAQMPTLAGARNNLAFILLTLGGDHLPDALDSARQAVAADPNSAAYRDTLARIQIARGERDAAAESFRQALNLDPRSVEAMIGLADLLAQSNQADEARALVARVQTTLNPKTRLPASLQKQLQAVRDTLSRARRDSPATAEASRAE